MKRLLHNLSDTFHIPQSWRNITVAWWKRFSHWKPPFYRRATTYGLNCEPRAIKITISLTSYPARIKTVSDTIDTLLNQTMKPDRLVLWLAESQFPKKEHSLPYRLLKQREYGLTVAWCEDLKSYKKLIPSLKAYPDDMIVTVDDDILYDESLIERLVSSYSEMPECIHSQLVMRIRYNGGVGFESYNDWQYDTVYGASYFNLLMGGSGTLYPPHCMPPETLKDSIFMQIASTVDDIWFWAMAVLAGRKVRHIPDGTEAHISQNPVASNRFALWNNNIDVANGNDAQLKAIVARYPDILNRFKVVE